MFILLPPSELKNIGGDGPALSEVLDAERDDSPELAFAQLNSVRQAVVSATEKLAGTPVKAAKLWKLSPKQASLEIELNRTLSSSGTMPAMDRYQGVLYEALAAPRLHADARAFLAANVCIQSALLGPVGCADPIPAYRLSFNSALPTLRDPHTKKAMTLKALWARHGAEVLRDEIRRRADLKRADNLVLDMRSEGYAALSPLTPQSGTYYLRVLSRGATGEVRALNHFNKKAKGELVRLCAEHYIEVARMNNVDDLMAWAHKHAIVMERGDATGKTGLAELNVILNDSFSIQQ